MHRTALRSALYASALLSTSALVVPFAGAAANTKASNEAPPAPAAAPVLEVGTVSDIDTDVAVPVKKGGKGGGTSPYREKLDRLEVGQSIHVAGKTKKSLNSTMHTINKAHRVYEKDANGNPVTEVKVRKKAGQEVRENVAKFTEAKRFDHYDVDATDKRGVGVRIFRTK